MAYNTKASQEISDFIVDKIKTGEWKPGDKIWSESEFCSKLEVSRIAVRDAISSLAAVSVLKKVKGSGTYVEDPENVTLEGIRYFRMDKNDVLQLMELRYIIDSYCTEQFALHATDEQIAELEECLNNMIANAREPDKYNFYGNQFHSIIARACNNKFIVKVNEYLRDNMLSHQFALSKELKKRKYQIGVSYHHKILQAIKRHDPEMAGAYCRYHIRLSMDLYRDNKIQGMDDEVLDLDTLDE